MHRLSSPAEGMKMAEDGNDLSTSDGKYETTTTFSPPGTQLLSTMIFYLNLWLIQIQLNLLDNAVPTASQRREIETQALQHNQRDESDDEQRRLRQKLARPHLPDTCGFFITRWSQDDGEEYFIGLSEMRN